MFGTIRKHSTVLWMIIITAIIVSFVVYFTPGGSRGAREAGANITLDGRTFTQDQLNAADRETRIGAMLGLSRAPESNEESTQRALERLLLLSKLDQYGISVGHEATAAWIRARILRDGSPLAGMTFDQVAERITKTAGLSAEDLQRFARNQAGFEILLETIGASGALITPQEVESAFRRDNEKSELEVAYIANSNFLAKVTLNNDAVTKFYSNRVAAYRSPDRVQVHYVRIATSNYVAEAERTLKAIPAFDAQINQAYQRRGTNFYAGLSETEAKGRIRQEIFDQEAFKLAKRKAYGFINTYYDSEPRTAGAMAAKAKAAGLELNTTNPFSREELPVGITVGPEFVEAAFSLTAEEPYSAAVTAPDGYYSLCFDKKLPGTAQAFADVRERVEKEFREDQARTLAREAADKFHQAATNATASQSFSSLAELSGFKVAKVPALTLRTTTLPGVELPVEARTLTAMASNMETNSVSRPQFAADGLMVLRLGARTAPTAVELAAGSAEYRGMLRRARESEVFNDWIMRQMELSGMQNMLRNPTR